MSFSPRRLGTRVHADRAAGRDRDHRDPDRPAPARRAEGPRGGGAHELLQQPQAARPRHAQPPRRGRQVPVRALRRRAEPAHLGLLLLPYIEQDNVFKTYQSTITGVNKTDGMNNHTATDPQMVGRPQASVKIFLCPTRHRPARSARSRPAARVTGVAVRLRRLHRRHRAPSPRTGGVSSW